MLVDMALMLAPAVYDLGVTVYESLEQAASTLTRPTLPEQAPPRPQEPENRPDTETDDRPPPPPPPPAPPTCVADPDPGPDPVYAPAAPDDIGVPAYAQSGYVEINPTRAALGPALGSDATVTPPGFVSGDDNHSRGHLIARQFGGDGGTIDNIVALFQNPTNRSMGTHENRLRTAIVARCETVLYEVRAEYGDGNPLPVAAVHLFAVGPTILVDVRCTNRTDVTPACA